jgi:hypothetical protein
MAAEYGSFFFFQKKKKKVDFTNMPDGADQSNTAIGTHSIVPQLSKEHKEIPI